MKNIVLTRVKPFQDTIYSKKQVKNYNLGTTET